MNLDYLKRWTNYRRQLSTRHVTPKINFYKNKEITQNSPETALVWFFVISLKYSRHLNKACMHHSTRKAFFLFLNVNFTLSAFYELLKSAATLYTFFTWFDVWNAFCQCFSPFELRSYRLRSFSDVRRYNYADMCILQSLKFIRN